MFNNNRQKMTLISIFVESKLWRQVKSDIKNEIEKSMRMSNLSNNGRLSLLLPKLKLKTYLPCYLAILFKIPDFCIHV